MFIKNYSSLIRTLLFCLLVTTSCGAGGGSAKGTEAGEPTSLPGSESNGLESSQPVDIPIPIAKGIEGIDPTSLRFTPASTYPVAGTLTGSLLDCDESVTDTGTCGLIMDGAIVSQVESANCDFSMPIRQSEIGELLALGVIENDQISTPLIIKVTADDFLQIFLTSITSITQAPVAVSSNGTIAFQAQARQEDESVNEALAEISIYGGDPTILVYAYTNRFDQLLYNYTDPSLLYGVDTEGSLYQATSSGLVGFLNDEDQRPPVRRLSFAPDDKWLVTNFETETTSGDSTESLAIVELNDVSNVIEVKAPDEPVTQLLPHWKSLAGLFATRQTESEGDTSYELGAYWEFYTIEDPSTPGELLNADDLAQVAADSEFSDLPTSSIPIGPIALGERPGQEDPSHLYFPCQGDDSVDLCLFDLSDDSGNENVTTVAVEGQGDVTKVEVSPSSSYAVFEIEDDTGTWIGLHLTEENKFIKATEGFNPTIFPTDENIIVYQCRDPEDPDNKLQLCLFIISNHISSSSAAQLALTSSSSTFIDECLAVTVTSQNSQGSSAEVGWATRINLAGKNATFYDDANCITAQDYVTIKKGTSSKQFGVKVSQAGSLTISASDNSGVLAATSLSVLVAENTNNPTQVTFAYEAIIGEYEFNVAGLCFPITVTTKDVNGQTTRVSAQTTITLGGGSGSFYSDSTCGATIVNTTLESGSSSKSLYYKTTVSGDTTLTAEGDLSGSLLLPLRANPYNLDLDGPSSATEGSCSGPFTASSLNFFNALAPISSARQLTIYPSHGDFTEQMYADPSCQTALSATPMASGTSQASFYIIFTYTNWTNKDLTSQTLSVSVVSDDLSSSNPTWAMHSEFSSYHGLTINP